MSTCIFNAFNSRCCFYHAFPHLALLSLLTPILIALVNARSAQTSELVPSVYTVVYILVAAASFYTHYGGDHLAPLVHYGGDHLTPLAYYGGDQPTPLVLEESDKRFWLLHFSLE